MFATLLSRIQRLPAWTPLIYFLLLVTASGMSLAALLAPVQLNEAGLDLQVGDVAPQEIRAPSGLSFQSQVLTEQRREAAASAVSPIYTLPDTSIARRRVERLRAVLGFITSVREDSFASRERQLADLAALEDIQLLENTAEAILALSDARWLVVQQEAILVLEQVMRASIRDYQLDDARRGVAALVSLSLPETQADIVAELVSAFVAPNSLFNEELTQAARDQAREAVNPVIRAYAPGEMIVDRGRKVTAADLEALQVAGLLSSTIRWQDIASAAALVLLTMGLMTLYLRYRPNMARDLRSMVVLVALFLAFLFGARLTIPGHTVIPYVYPLAAFGLVVATLFGTRYGLAFAVPLSLLVSYGLPNALDLTFYYLLGTTFGVLMLGRGVRISSFIWSGIAIAATSAVTVIAYRLADPASDWVGIATLSGAAALNGVASASLAVLLQFFLAQLLGLTTALQLLEISRPDQPLLQFILRNAPGTYQHSLQVSTLAEQAAERIGADALLTRVGALYHDVGKALNPYFYIENQVPGFENPHDQLDPYESAAIIIRHVTDGLELARKYRLPRRIHDFIAEHHGDMLTRYQFAQALNAAGGDASQVEPDLFRYPGPRPQSRETALVMLADGCEARVRAERPKSETELNAMIKEIVDARLADGQLDETALTTRDLHLAVEVFTVTLRGVYHPRIDYPKLDARTVPLPAPRAELASPADPLQQTDPRKTTT